MVISMCFTLICPCFLFYRNGLSLSNKQYLHFPNQKFQILSSNFNSCSVISNHVHEFKVPASLSSTVSSNLTINFHFLPSILLTYCTHFFESCHTVQYILHILYVLFHIRHTYCFTFDIS